MRFVRQPRVLAISEQGRLQLNFGLVSKTQAQREFILAAQRAVFLLTIFLALCVLAFLAEASRLVMRLLQQLVSGITLRLLEVQQRIRYI